jgi:beta-glucosidase
VTDVLPFRDPALPVPERVEDLLGRLTLDEKISLLHQRVPAMPRLGLAEFHTGQEALHGVAWIGEATVFPQAVGLGATWHPALLRRLGAATGTEVRAYHERDPLVGLNVWAPVVNPLRDPRWGRNEEGYSEDPYLVGVLATEYCAGLRGDDPAWWRTVPTLKHALGYNVENDRARISVDLRPRVLHEYELPAFTAPLAAGAAGAVMPSYNLVNGRPAHVSPCLALLRSAAAQDIAMVSDAYAPSNLTGEQAYFATPAESHAAALRAGLDSFTDHDGDNSFTVAALTEALRAKLIDESDVDTAVRRVLTLRFRTGEFGPDPYAGTGALCTPEHQALAGQAAREAIVLLRNENDALPLAGRDRIAVVGPLADVVLTDWYSGSLPYRVPVRAALAERVDRLSYVDGADRIALRAGTGRYLTVAGGTLTADAEEPTGAALFDLTDWGGGAHTLRSAASGRYLTVREDGALADAAEAPGGWVVQESLALERDGAELRIRHLASGRYFGLSGTEVRLVDEESAATLHSDVIVDGAAAVAAAARDADAVVVVLGNDPHINGRETEDRADLSLPAGQDALLRAARTANPRTVLALVSSYPYALGWAAERVPAILWTAHGGQEGGRALADVLLGAHNPGGRLPQTWYRTDAELPDPRDYDIIATRSTYQYFDGEPLFPFGHGLSYTRFAYTGPAPGRVSATASDTVRVEVTVANTGERDGTEVVQVYGCPDDPDLPGPRRRLLAFERVALRAGQRRRIELPVPVDRLACWDTATGGPIVYPGRYRLVLGGSATDERCAVRLTVTGPPLAPRSVVDTRVPAADFDDAGGVRLVDETPAAGDAVGCDGTGYLVFGRCALPAGEYDLAFRVAGAQPGATVEVDTGGTVLARLAPPETGRYEWITRTVPVRVPDGAGEIRVTLTGALRIAWFEFRTSTTSTEPKE